MAIRIAFFSLISLFLHETAFSQECVVLLHGLARTSNSMKKLERRLEGEGYKVINIDYPSREYPIQTLAEITVAKALDECGASQFLMKNKTVIDQTVYFLKNGAFKDKEQPGDKP